MNRELQNLLCSCSSDCVGNASNRYVQQKDEYNDHDIACPRYESDRDEKLLDDWKVLDDDSWDVISTLRQKFCQLSKSEAESTTIKESPHSSCTYTHGQPFEYHSIVERASNLIDYTPESEFLKKIKQQCQYLHNRLPNIFSALNDCFPEGEVNECQKCLLRRGAHQRSCTSWKRFSFNDDFSSKNRMNNCSIFQRPCSGVERSRPIERLELGEKKSKHISRSKKPSRRRKVKKRKSKDSGKCMSESDFEPSLKKPNENSCERCWRFASPARSPVNKPDQRYDPNFRRAHSTTTLDKGDGEFDNCAEAESPDMSGSRNACPNVGKDLPCMRHTCDTGPNRISQPPPQQILPPHICIKQKMEAWQMGQGGCPKHRLTNEQPRTTFSGEYAGVPTSPQRSCPKHRLSPQPPQNAPPPQHLCSKHMGSMPQSEPPGPRQRPKCPVHDPDPPQQRPPQQKCPQYRSPARSPVPGPSQMGKHSCRQSSEEASRGILCSGSGKKQRPMSNVSGTRDFGRSPCGAEDLDVTQYKDICIKSKKQNLSQSPDPCRRAEQKKIPTCGGCPPKPTRTCDSSKMETIPEGEPTKKQGGDNVRGSMGNNNGNINNNNININNKNNNNNNNDNNNNKRGGDLGSKSSKDSKQQGDSKKDKSGSKSDSKPPSKSGSKAGSKSDSKPASKAMKEKPQKKSPDRSPRRSFEKPKPKPQTQSRGDDGAGTKGPCAAKKTAGQFDKAHPIRPCRCPPRMSESEFGPGSPGGGCGGHTLCCHCDWGENNGQVNVPPQGGRPNGSPGCGCNPARRSTAPEVSSPVPKAGAMECPYRTFMNKYGGGRGSPCVVQQEENRRCSREDHSEISTQELLQCTPRKYFVFYMSKAKEKNENDVEVVVEELEKNCPKSDAAARAKNITEKMKKISEPPPDSMALRFQKGVTEGCNAPQSSRILYF